MLALRKPAPPHAERNHAPEIFFPRIFERTFKFYSIQSFMRKSLKRSPRARIDSRFAHLPKRGRRRALKIYESVAKLQNFFVCQSDQRGIRCLRPPKKCCYALAAVRAFVRCIFCDRFILRGVTPVLIWFQRSELPVARGFQSVPRACFPSIADFRALFGAVGIYTTKDMNMTADRFCVRLARP